MTITNGQLKWSKFKNSNSRLLDDSGIPDWAGSYGNFIEASQLLEVVRQHPQNFGSFSKALKSFVESSS